MTSDRRPTGSLRSGLVWSLLSFVATKSLTFLATLVLARLVAPADFGLLAAVLAFIGFLEVISDVGMKATVIYESERGITSRVQTAFTLNLVFTLLLASIAVLLAPEIARFFDAESHTTLFRVAAADLLLVGLGNIHDSLLLRDMEFRRRLVPQVVGNLVRAVCTILLAISGFGATALVVGFISGTAAWTITLWIVRPFLPTLTVDRTALGGVAAYGGWASALEVIAAIGARMDAVVIGGALGAVALGLYTIAQRVPELIIGNVTWNLSIVAFPALAQRRNLGHRQLTDTTLKLIRYSALFGLTVGTGLAVLASPLVVVLFSETWTEAGAVMTPLALMYGLLCIVFPLGDTFKALGKQRVMVAVNTIAIPISIAAMAAAAPAGVAAVAWARTVVTVAQGVVFVVLIARVLGIRLATVAGALRPACAASAGVALAGIAVRMAWPDISIGPLLVAAVAAAVGGGIALRVLAVQQYDQLRALVLDRLFPASMVPLRSRPNPQIASVERK
jgi:PST family polysaccharide transporter